MSIDVTDSLEEWIADAANMPSLAAVVGALHIPNMTRSGRDWVSGPCVRCGGTDRMAINAKAGKWFCRGCRPQGGGTIGMVMHVKRMNYDDAMRWISRNLTKRML